jgi:hypothetical protein
MRSELLSIALAASVLVPATTVAQGCAANNCRTVNELTANVGALMGLTLDRPAAVTVTPSRQEIAKGAQVLSGPTAHVKSNTDWRLEVSAATSEWNAAEGARAGKPAADLAWRVNANGSYTPLSTEPEQAAVGSHTPSTDVAFQYQTTFDNQQDRPGTYSLVVRYTLTTR